MADFDTDDPHNIWVSPDSHDDSSSPDGGIGTYEEPLTSLSSAFIKVIPGQRIILLPGTYPGDQTIDISGEPKNPIHIIAYKPKEVVIEGGCWYFYDASDLVVSGLTFKNAPRGAISVIGQCHRNHFQGIDFIDCGEAGKASCTFYFGGAGAMCNLVNGCNFLRSAAAGKQAGLSTENAVVGLMVSDGTDDGGFLENHVITHNRFSGYDEAIILGAGNAADFDSGHIIAYNEIENCRFEGIVVRCNDARILENIIGKCGTTGIVAAGNHSMIARNRISGCDYGVSLGGSGHSITLNRFTGCETALIANGRNAGGYVPIAQNLLISENHFVNSGIIIDEGTSGAILGNRFYGSAAIEQCKPVGDFAINNNTGNISINEYVDEYVDNDRADEDAGAESGYADASIHDEDIDDSADGNDGSNDYGDDGDIGDVGGSGSIINYMFNIGERE